MRVKVVKVRIVNILIFSVNNLMNKDSDKISLMLDFLSKNCRDERVRSLLGQGKDLFYQIPCEELKKKSLLQYIDAQGSKMVRQKEELIDLAIKIQKINLEEKLIKKLEGSIKYWSWDMSSTQYKLKCQAVQDLVKKYVEGLQR